MFPRFMRVFGVLGTSATLVCCLSMAAGSETPTRFAGTYQLSSVVEDGSEVHLTITLTVLNSSNSEIDGGIVALLNSQPDNALIGSFQAIKQLPSLRYASVSQDFTVSAVEYARWQSGHDPVFQFLIPSPPGSTPVHIQARRIVNPSQTTN